MEINKIAVKINEAVDLEDMITIVNEDLFIDFGDLSEDTTLLDEEVKSGVFSKLSSKIAEAKKGMVAVNLSKGQLTALIGTLSVAAVALVAMESKRIKKIVDHGYSKEDEAEDLEESNDWVDQIVSAKRDNVKARKDANLSKEEVTKIIHTRDNAKKTYKKSVGMVAIILGSISIIAQYVIMCRERGISVGAPAKSALNRVKNIFKSAKSKNPDKADQYDDMIDRIDNAIDKVGKE